MYELNIFIIGSVSLVLNVLSNRPALMLLDNTNSSRCSLKETPLLVSNPRSITVLFSSII